MIRINLLPLRAERKKEDARRSISIYVLAVALCLVVIGWSHVSGVRKVSRLAREVASNKAEIARYQKLTEEIKSLGGQKKALEAKLNVIQTLEKSKTGPVHLLDELATRLPERRLWLTELDQRANALSIKGEALDNDSIATYMRQLAASNYITGVDLVSAEQKERDGIKVMEFAVTCQLCLTGAGGPQQPAQPAGSEAAAARMAKR